MKRLSSRAVRSLLERTPGTALRIGLLGIPLFIYACIGAALLFGVATVGFIAIASHLQPDHGDVAQTATILAIVGGVALVLWALPLLATLSALREDGEE
jgi:hypothetical protein